MIPAAAVFAVVLTTSTERDALLSRWAHAARAAVPASRLLRDASAPPSQKLASIHALAAGELRVPGRYRLGETAALPRGQTWWERLASWLGDRWSAFIKALFGRARLNPKVAGAIGDAIVGLLVLVVAAAGIRIILVYGRRSARASAVRALAPGADASMLYAMASERADCGEFAAASQLLFRATLALLDVRGTLRDDASATVGEIRLRLPARDVVSAFDAIARAFVAGTYAERPLDAAQWERARDAYLALAREPAA
jgi:hypothetical protein